MQAKQGQVFNRALILGLIGLMAAMLHVPHNLNHDAAWHMQTAFRVLTGDELGVDVFDINPPMSAWLFSLPAAFSNWTGFAPGLTFKLFFIMIALGAIYAHGAIFRRFGQSEKQSRAMICLLGLAAFVLPGYDFAQREQFAALLTLCYVASVIHRADGKDLPKSASIAVGIVAAIGICIKPYFLLLPIIMELWLMVKRRSVLTVIRVETIALLSVLFAYLAAIAIFAPSYFSVVIPESLNNYGGYSVPFMLVAYRVLQIILPVIIGLAVLLLLFRRAGSSAAFQGYAAASLAFLLAALAQQKGWHYQIFPVMFFGILAIGSQIIRPDLRPDAPVTLPVSRVGRWMLAAGLVAVMVQPAIRLLQDEGTGARIAALESAINTKAQDLGEPVSVMAFITSPRDIHPAVLNTRAVWAHDAGAIVYLPAALSAKSAEPGLRERILQTAKRHDDAMIERLTLRPPDIIIVEDGPYKLGISDPDFDYLAYYNADAGFEALMRQYEESDPVGHFRMFSKTPQSQPLAFQSSPN